MVSIKEVGEKGVNEIKYIYKAVYETISPRRLTRFINTLINYQNKKANSKIMDYLRLYTHLNTAIHKWDPKNRERGVNSLKLVKDFTKTSPFKEEELYYKKINDIVSKLIADSTCKECDSNSCEHVAPQRVLTRMKLAQNICTLRMLRVHS